MKRPLFWAVAAFALGEVTGMFASGIWQIGIALAMLICDAVYIIKKPDKWKYIVAMYVFMLLGILNVIARTPPDFLEYENAELEGYVYNKVVTANGINGYMRVDIIDGEELGYTLNAVVYKLPEDIDIGDYIEIRGSLASIKEAANPGQFDMKRYYRARGIEAAVTYMDKYEVLSREGNNYREFIFDIRKSISDQMYAVFDEFTADMYSGLLLGDRQGLDDMTRKLYQVGGISHILAISGVKTLKLDIPLVPETRINWAFVPLHIAIIYILKLYLDEEIIPRCRFPCSRGYFKKCINWQKKQSFSVSLILWQKSKKWQKEKMNMAYKKYREMKVYEASGYQYKRTPSIVLKGKWLSELGFDIGEQIEVKCEDGRLVITKADEI